MNIHEYQAKALLRSYGAPVSDGRVVLRAEEAKTAAGEMDGPLWVVKAQIHAGGRGKGSFKEADAGDKGGVRLAKSVEEAAEEAKKMLGRTLVTHQTGPAGKQVNRIYIEDGSGIETETVRRRQMQLEPTLLEQLKDHGRELLRAAKYGSHTPGFDSKIQHGLEGLLKDGKWGKAPGYEPRKFDRLKLDSKTVLVIDESSMLGLKDTERMLRLAADAGVMVVMVGDERQLPAIESVSPFEALAAAEGRFELSEIKRQELPWMRDAVQAFANGDTDTGLSLLKEHGSLRLGQGGPAATKDRLVSDWLKADGAVGEKLILAATNDDARDLNARAQEARRVMSDVGQVLSVTLGSDEKAFVGDRVLFNQNDRRLDVYNGELGTITRIHRPADLLGRKRGEVTVQMDHGAKVRIDLTRFDDQTNAYAKRRDQQDPRPSTSLGYALTTHKAQGSTVDRSFTYTTPETAARDMLYVQTSRARNEMLVYAPGHDLGEDLQDFKDSLTRETGQRELAHQQAERLEQQRQQELEEQRLRELERERQRQHQIEHLRGHRR